MTAKKSSRKTRKSAFSMIVSFVVLPLIAINAYAFWRLSQATGHWTLSVVPNSLSESLTQLAVILAINNAVIALLLIKLSSRN